MTYLCEVEICECQSLLSSLRKKQNKNVVCVQTDDGPQRVEDPRALIPYVENGGCQCGSANNNLVMKNDMCKRRIKTHTHTYTHTHTHTGGGGERERERKAQSRYVLF